MSHYCNKLKMVNSCILEMPSFSIIYIIVKIELCRYVLLTLCATEIQVLVQSLLILMRNIVLKSWLSENHTPIIIGLNKVNRHTSQ